MPAVSARPKPATSKGASGAPEPVYTAPPPPTHVPAFPCCRDGLRAMPMMQPPAHRSETNPPPTLCLPTATLCLRTVSHIS